MYDELLFDVPDYVDYTSIAKELDEEDIPIQRIQSVHDLLHHADSNIVLEAAMLLSSWGCKEGFDKLVWFLEQPKLLNDELNYEHRLYNYNQVYELILDAILSYRAKQFDRGNESIREEIFQPLKNIIQISNFNPIDINLLYPMLTRKKYEEYIPLIKQHLEAIIDHKDIHGWKIHDAIKLLLNFDAEWINNFLKIKKYTLKDFNF